MTRVAMDLIALSCSILLCRVAQARQWKIVLTNVAVEPAKANGQPWDGDNSAPDVTGSFAAGVVDGSECRPGRARPIEKRQDAIQFQPNIQMIVEAEVAWEICADTTVVDKDVLDDDLIGRGSDRLLQGSQDIRVGQATLTIVVTPVEEEPSTSPANSIPAPARLGSLYRVSIVSASIARVKPDASTWDPADDPEAEQAKELASLANIGLMLIPTGTAAQVLGALVGVQGRAAASGPSHVAQTRAAPDTQVKMQWGDLSFDTTVHRNTYAPSWRTEFLVPKNVLESMPARIDVVDDDDGVDDHIATDVVPPKRFMGDGIVRLKTFGSVNELILHVDEVVETESPRETTVSLTAAKRVVHSGLTVLGGQTVHVTTTGQVCTNDGCFTGDGDPDRVVDVRGVPIRLGQLVAVVGDDVYPVGAVGSFVVKSSGKLSLAIARGTVSSGAFQATARVFYPVVQKPRAAGTGEQTQH